jgi:hypothetical protein
VLEVCFTGTSAALFERDRSATGKTYLWMHPIYGATALGLEYLASRLKFLPRPVRALAYTAVIFGAEYGTGWLLRRVLGRCPWDYTNRGWNVKGLIRLDYAPAWYATALLFEPLRDALYDMTRQASRTAEQVLPTHDVEAHPGWPSDPEPLERKESPERQWDSEEQPAAYNGSPGM